MNLAPTNSIFMQRKRLRLSCRSMLLVIYTFYVQSILRSGAAPMIRLEIDTILKCRVYKRVYMHELTAHEWTREAFPRNQCMKHGAHWSIKS